ncbi:MAG: NADPH:quinone oxidoreductase family protein [Caulobacteraceae bacterium]|nr:NADPH:quinone oxidoreductase family protein [Caulobacteraceae bacterium]
MRALTVHELTPDYRGVALTDSPTPAPGQGEVLLEVRAAAVNFPDILQTRGEYQHKPPLPFISGMELAGVVVAVGEGAGAFRAGDEVVGRPELGGFSDVAICKAAEIRLKPARLSFSEAAAFGAAYLTAYVALVRRARVEAGEWVLVHGAAGGVGLACVDMAKAFGCRVIAAASSDAKLAVIADEYAPDALINVVGGFRDEVKTLTDGRGADVIYDPVSGDVFDESVRCIAFEGRLLVVGFTSGRIANVSVNMPLIKGFSVVGVRAGEYGRRFPDRGAQDRDVIWRMAAEGRLRPRVHREHPLADWRAAFDSLTDRTVIGKAVITP